MSRVLTVAVTRLVPVTEVFTIQVDDDFDLDEKVGTSIQQGQPEEMYQIMEKDGVKIAVPVEGDATDYDYSKVEDMPGAAVGPNDLGSNAKPLIDGQARVVAQRKDG